MNEITANDTMQNSYTPSFDGRGLEAARRSLTGADGIRIRRYRLSSTWTALLESVRSTATPRD